MKYAGCYGSYPTHWQFNQALNRQLLNGPVLFRKHETADGMYELIGFYRVNDYLPEGLDA